jgi:hypothetical protein
VPKGGVAGTDISNFTISNMSRHYMLEAPERNAISQQFPCFLKQAAKNKAFHFSSSSLSHIDLEG